MTPERWVSEPLFLVRFIVSMWQTETERYVYQEPTQTHYRV